jgi:hypothetical protein
MSEPSQPYGRWQFDEGLAKYLQDSSEILADATSGDSRDLQLLNEAAERLNAAVADANSEPDIPGQLLAAHGFMMFLAAARTALSGHAQAVYPLLRTALESVCYYSRTVEDKSLGAVWLARHDDATSKKAARAAFNGAVSETAKSIAKVLPNAGKHLTDTYDSLIDFGAHPNLVGVFKGISLEERPEGIAVKMTSLFGHSHALARESMLACTELAVTMIMILKCPPVSGPTANTDAISDAADFAARCNEYFR